MKYPTNTMNWNGTEIVNIWMRMDSLEGLIPIRQVYGICFNDKDEILIARRDKNDDWQIPGGHPEKDETIEQTLQREMLEEVDVKVKNIKVLGVQKAYPKEKPNETIYQVRCICEIDELLPQTPDPANGDTWERKFVSASEITNYVKWNITGDAMFEDAIKLFKG